MNGMLIHLDEELTNNRPGHSYDTTYRAADLALWINFYSLFFDRVLVPANFLTDSNLVHAVLDLLGASDPNSLISLPGFPEGDGPFQILWDEKRFPYSTFGEMLTDIKVKRAPDASLRKIWCSELTADACDRHLSRKGKLLRHPLGIRPHNEASTLLLQEQVLDPSQNAALLSLPPADWNRLRDSVSGIVNEGGPIGYGRNFFYTLFGHDKTQEGIETADRFRRFTAPISDLQHVFLSAVDYASNSIKARVAEENLRVVEKNPLLNIAALLPSEYQRVFRRRHVDELWRQGGEAGRDALAVKGRHRYLLDQDSLTSMTVDQFRRIRSGGEYQSLKTIVDRAALGHAGTLDRAAVEGTLNAYLARIESVLNPARRYGDRGFAIAGRMHLSGNAATILCGLGAVGASIAPEPAAKVFEYGIALVTAVQGAQAGVDALRAKLIERREFPIHGFQLGRDIPIRLLKPEAQASTAEDAF